MAGNGGLRTGPNILLLFFLQLFFFERRVKDGNAWTYGQLAMLGNGQDRGLHTSAHAN